MYYLQNWKLHAPAGTTQHIHGSRVEKSGLGFCFYWNWGCRPRVSRAHSLLVNLKQKGKNLKYGKKGLSWWLSGEEFACQCRKHAFDPWSLKIPGSWWDLLDPMHHNYWACALEPRSLNYWSLSALEPSLYNKRSHRNEKPMCHN